MSLATDKTTRLQLARDAGTDLKLLHQLAVDTEYEIRAAVASNANTPVTFLKSCRRIQSILYVVT